MASKKISLHVLVKPKTKQQLQEIADKKDVTLSELTRQIVENYAQMM